MFFSILTKEVDSKHFCKNAFILAVIFVVSSIPVKSYADNNLPAANTQTQVVSAPFATLFPEVTGTPWLQQMNEVQQERQNWVHVSSRSTEPVPDAGKLQNRTPHLINLAAGNMYGYPDVSVEQISGIFNRDHATIREVECFEQESCVHQSSKSSSKSIRICSSSRTGNSKYPLNEELAPAQRLSRQPWRSPIGVDPWMDVFQIENRASATFFGEKRIKESDYYHQKLQNNLNTKLLAKDRPITQMSLNVQPEPGRMPEQRGTPSDSNSSATGAYSSELNRSWRDCLVHWNASEASHGPLYFEESNLERHGYSRGYWQPAVSGFRFIATAPLLPGLMTIDRPFSLQYELGEARVGSCTPYRAQKTPWNARAIFVEIGVVTGISFIIP